MWYHRDGSKQGGKSGKPGCKKRHLAIKKGCILPLSFADQRAQAASASTSAGQTSIMNFAQKVPKFDNRVLNQMVGMWVIRTAQPWARIQDVFLRACFRYANPNAQLFGKTWVARFAHEAYLEMRASVIGELQVSLLQNLFFVIPRGD